MMKSIEQRYMVAINRLAKWRMVFAGWQLGTRPKGDPECDAVRDHREITMLLRVEVSAITRLLIEKGMISHEECLQAMTEEADQLSKDYEQRFPGMRATDSGMQYDIRAAETMKHWKP